MASMFLKEGKLLLFAWIRMEVLPAGTLVENTFQSKLQASPQFPEFL